VCDRKNWPVPSWGDVPIILTYHAAEQAYQLGLDLYDIGAILEGGYDCERGRRKKNVRERCTRWKRSWLRVVVALEPSGYTEGANAWIVLAIKPTEEP
jgi:hypothetical protein